MNYSKSELLDVVIDGVGDRGLRPYNFSFCCGFQIGVVSIVDLLR
jgi:hypothetical protein